MSSPWLRRAHVDRGALVVPGRPANHAATVRLVPAGLQVYAGGQVATLPWTQFGSAWNVVPWDTWRAGGTGVGLRLDPATASTLEPLLRETRTVRNRFGNWPVSRRATVPTHATMGQYWFQPAGRATFGALCELLRRRAPARERLGSPAVTERLAADLRRRQLRTRVEPASLRGSTMEILVAMRRRRYVHELRGRPVAGEPLPSREEVIADLAGSLRYRRETIVRVARKHYLDVEPWPFGALVG